MFKKTFFAFLFFIGMVQSSSAQIYEPNVPYEFTCVQVEDGKLTGKTTILTVTFSEENNVEVVRTERKSTSSDAMKFYNLTDNNLKTTEDGTEVKNGTSTWIVPFDGGMAYRANADGTKVECNCTEDGDCGFVSTPKTGTCRETCSGCCQMTLVWGSSTIIGGGILIDANNVNYTRN
jgi:hypothetical protein